MTNLGNGKCLWPYGRGVLMAISVSRRAGELVLERVSRSVRSASRNPVKSKQIINK